MGGPGGKEESTESQLDGRESVQEPDVLRFSNPKETQNDEGSKDVRQDEDVLTVITVRHHPGDGADQKRSQHSHQEKAPHRKS
jgi:hypothetical protein